jgi:hypothetical protein
MTGHHGVSFVVPVYNGRQWLPSVLDAIRSQGHGGPWEIILVDDGGTDGASRWLRERAAAGALTVVAGPRRGAAAAVNAGIREARYPIICQVDQDVVPQPRWLAELLTAFDDPDVAAAQGRYILDASAGFWARVMGRDLEWRYARMRGDFTDHACTGNTAYRARALHAVGLLDETLGYGYDNDLSYRLARAGYRLAFCRGAVSVHHWREGASGYVRQQFGVGYGRLDVLCRHPSRMRGDQVSNAVMMAHAPVTLLALVLLAVSALSPLSRATPALAYAAGALFALLSIERAVAGVRAWRHTGDHAALAFPVAHLARNAAWAWAIVLWMARRIAGRSPLPTHSMRRRHASMFEPERPQRLNDRDLAGTLLALVPAYNEVESLERVVGELRRLAPAADVLVVNDGSTDATPDLLPELGVNWLTMPTRVGVGGAVRAGLRYAVARGYTYVVRIDGDGQHRVADIGRLLAPVAADRLDAAIGSRFMGRRQRRRPTLLRSAQAVLAACLSATTRRRITDPTSGFCLFGPRALQLLARHHPTGYAEPELILLLHRNGFRVGEVPVRTRPRRTGRTSLTPARALVACGRTLLALLLVPTRRAVADRSES